MELFFVFTKKTLEWDQIQWYRYLFYKAKFGGGVIIWVLLRYYASQKSKPSKTTILPISGYGQPEDFSVNNYSSDLDRFIPNKKVQSKRDYK